jgi:lipid kinase YegS
MSKHWRLIVNGKCAGSEPLRQAVIAMRERGVALSVRVTWELGDAERYVSEAISDGIVTIIAAGGDGTLSEVATTLAHRDESAEDLPSLGLVPMGTANDFAAAAQLSCDPTVALALIHDVVARPIDLLRLDDGDTIHWCANLASGGFGSQITVDTDDGLKKMLGGLAYLITGIANLGGMEHTHARICGSGPAGPFEWKGDFIALGLGNGRLAGGGQLLCPDAIIDDGLIDVTIVPELTGEVGATVRTLITEGKQAALDRVAVRVQLPWIEIETQEPLTLNLDGEPVESTQFRIECIPRCVRMHLPADCPLLGLPGNPLHTPVRADIPEPPSGVVLA